MAVKRFNMRKSMAFLLSAAICVCNINVGTVIAAEDGSGFLMVDHKLTEDGMGAVVRVEETGPGAVITSVEMISGEGTRVSVGQEKDFASTPASELSQAGQIKVWKAEREPLPDTDRVETNRQDTGETENVPPEGETAESEGETAKPEGETVEPEGEAAKPEGETAESEGEAVELEDETANTELKTAEIEQKVSRSRSEVPVVKTSGMLPGGNDAEERDKSFASVETGQSEEEEDRNRETEVEETVKPDSEKPETGTGNAETGKPEAGNTETGKPESGDPEVGKPGTGDIENGKPEPGNPENGATEIVPPENEKPGAGTMETPDESTPSEADKPLPSEPVTSTPSEAVTSTPSDAGSNSDGDQAGDYEYQEFAFYVNENGRYRFKVEYVTWQDVEVTGSNRKKLQKTVGADTELQEGDVVQKPVTKIAVLSYRIDDISGLYFEGMSKLETRVGEAVDLMEGVSAEDERRKPVEELRIADDGGFNLYEANDYTVIYEAVHPVSGVVYQAERSVSVLPSVSTLADNIQITTDLFGEGEGKTLEYLLGSGLYAGYNWSIEAVVPEGTGRKITVTVPSIFELTGTDSAEASVSNLGSVCEFTIWDGVAAGAVIELTGTFQQSFQPLDGSSARFDSALEDEYRETGEVEFGSISATMTRGDSIVGKSEIGPLVTKKPVNTYDDIVYLPEIAAGTALKGKDLQLSYSGEDIEKCYLEGQLIVDYRSDLKNYLRFEMYNSGLVPYNIDSIEFYIPEEFDVFLDELKDGGEGVSVSEQRASDDSPFPWREQTDSVIAVRYQCDDKTDAEILSDIEKIYVGPKQGVSLEARRYETYTSKKGILSSPFAEKTIAVTDDDGIGTVGFTAYPHSYNFESVPLGGGDYVLLRRLQRDLPSGYHNFGRDICDVIAVNGTTLGNTITIKTETEFLRMNGIICSDTWTELRVDYLSGRRETFSNPRGYKGFPSAYGGVKELKITSTGLEDRWLLTCGLGAAEGTLEGTPANMEIIIGEAPNQTTLTLPFKIYKASDMRIVGLKDGLNIIEGDNLQIQGWENTEIQYQADDGWKALPSEIEESLRKTIRAFRNNVGLELVKAANQAGNYEVRYTASRGLDFAAYSATATRNLNVQSRVKLKEGGNNYYEEEGRKEKPVFVYTHYDESNPDGREVTVSETFIKPADGGDGTFKLTPGVHKRDYEITHPESFEKTEEVTPGPGHHSTLEGSVVVDGKPEITVQEQEFTTIPGGKLTGLLDAGQVSSVYRYYEYKDGKIVEDAQKPARITLTDYLGQPVLNGEYVAPLDPGTYYLTYEAEAVDKVYVNGSNRAEPVRIKVVVTSGVEIETKNEIYVSDEQDKNAMKTKIAATGVWKVGSASGALTKDQFQYSFTKKADNLWEAEVTATYTYNGKTYSSNASTVTIHIRQLPTVKAEDSHYRIQDTFDPYEGVEITPDDGENQLTAVMPEGFNMDAPGEYEVLYKAYDPLLDETTEKKRKVYIHGIPVIEATDREIYTHESTGKNALIEAIKATPPTASVTYYVPAANQTVDYPITEDKDPIQYRVLDYKANTEGTFKVELTVDDKNTRKDVFTSSALPKEAEGKKIVTVTVRDKKYPVVFHAGDHGSYAEGDSTTIMASHGKAPSIPWPNAEEGYVVDHWVDDTGARVNDMKARLITGPEEFTAVYRKKTYTVRFIGRGDRIIKTQIVTHGESAEAPTEDRDVKSNRFAGWSRSFDYVTSDLNVYVQFWTSHSGGPKPGGSGSPGGPGVKNEDDILPDLEIPMGLPQPQIINEMIADVPLVPWDRKNKKGDKNRKPEEQSGPKGVQAELVENQEGQAGQDEDSAGQSERSSGASTVYGSRAEKKRPCVVHWFLLLVGALEACYYMISDRKKRSKQKQDQD